MSVEAARLYVDSSVLVTPMLKNREQPVIDTCVRWLERAARNEIRLVTSWLTWDEVLYIAGRGGQSRYDRERAREAGERLLRLPAFAWVEIGEPVVTRAQALLGATSFRPRDCLHAATALLECGGRLLSLDSDFLKASGTQGVKLVSVEADSIVEP